MLSGLRKLRRKLQIAATYRQAKKGGLIAQYEMGRLYHELGAGYLPQAFAWLTIASNHGHCWALSELAALEAKLPLAQLNEGRELAAEYKLKYDAAAKRQKKSLRQRFKNK